MIYIDKNTFPYCYVEEKKLDWGEPYTHITPIFNVSIDPALSPIAFTIEVLGKNNFKLNLEKLYNILLNEEEQERIENCNTPVLDRELLLHTITTYLYTTINNSAPWLHYYEEHLAAVYESLYLQSIEEALGRKLWQDRKL